MTDKKFTDMADWDDIRFFLALARHGSLSATARSLNVTHATVSRRVTALEDHLGCSLLHRRPDGYELTDQGRSILDAAERMERAAHDLQGNLDGVAGLQGVVRLSTTRSLADGFLARRLCPIIHANPGLCIELVADSRNVSLARHQADLAIRLGAPTDGDIRAKRLGRLGYGYYGTTAWRDAAQTGDTVPLIGFDPDSSGIADAAWLDRHFSGWPMGLRSNSQMAHAQAAQAGMGVAMLPHYLGRQMPDLHLIPLSPAAPERPLWLLLRPESARNPRIRLVADFLTQLFTDCRNLLG